uniref:Myb/SANT-like DNA-binding domain-containing protein n=1 Tax=Myripristis murdjan TaxID=586833 RepID=A0A667ZA49_9TELE
MAAAKGSRWLDEEVECLIEIWAEDGIQQQLDRTHKNSEVFGKIRDHLESRGYRRSVDQCRDKVKKLRIQYLRIRDALRKSGSSPDEKEKFRWYDAIDAIIGRKPTSQPVVLESSLPPKETTAACEPATPPHSKFALCSTDCLSICF